jgi:hypothetical protein
MANRKQRMDNSTLHAISSDPARWKRPTPGVVLLNLKSHAVFESSSPPRSCNLRFLPLTPWRAMHGLKLSFSRKVWARPMSGHPQILDRGSKRQIDHILQMFVPDSRCSLLLVVREKCYWAPRICFDVPGSKYLNEQAKFQFQSCTQCVNSFCACFGCFLHSRSKVSQHRTKRRRSRHLKRFLTEDAIQSKHTTQPQASVSA